MFLKETADKWRQNLTDSILAANMDILPSVFALDVILGTICLKISGSKHRNEAR